MTGVEAACWTAKKQGVSVRKGGMIIGRALVRTAVEGVGADLRRRTWLVRGPRPLTEHERHDRWEQRVLRF